jgi:hypothetical protein
MRKLGGSGVASVPDPDDDLSIQPDELVWHIVLPDYFVENPAIPGKKIIKSAAMAHGHSGVSFLRPKLGVDLAMVRSYFPKAGIAEMTAGELRQKARCLLVIENDPKFPWPKDSHVCAYGSPGKARIKKGRLSALVALTENSVKIQPLP